MPPRRVKRTAVVRRNRTPAVSFVAQDIPSDVVALVTNGMLVVGIALVIAVDGQSVTAYLTHEKAPYMYAAGIALSVGIVAYYRALALGPVSVVVPVFGLLLVTGAVLGVVLLDEALTLRKAAGIVLAMLAVYLTAGAGAS